MFVVIGWSAAIIGVSYSMFKPHSLKSLAAALCGLAIYGLLAG